MTQLPTPSARTSARRALIAQTILKQATLLSYIDAFWLLTVVCVLAIAVAFVLRPMPLGKEAPAVH